MDGKPIIEKRRGPDLLIKIIDLSSVILWCFLIFNFGLIISAKPEGETFFDRLFNISVRNYWDYQLLQLCLIFSVMQLVVSVISLFLNSKRLKRKDDRIKASILISLFSSLVLSILLIIIIFR